MIWLLLAAGLLTSEPRWTMDAQPAATVRAEIFDRSPGEPARQAASLLNTADLLERPLSEDQADIVFATAKADAGATQGVVLYARGGSHTEAKWFCRLSPTGNAGQDNGARALHWCLSFIGQTPVVAIKPE